MPPNSPEKTVRLMWIPNEVETAARWALEPFERTGENPYQVQKNLQELMQNQVGIVRREEEMRDALEKLTGSADKASQVGVVGNREYNGGWHTALDLRHLLTVSEIITRAASNGKKAEGRISVKTIPRRVNKRAAATLSSNETITARCGWGVNPSTAMPADLKQIIEEMK